jgi:hypothetical protein
MKVVKTRRYKIGYEVRRELLSFEEAGETEGVVLRSAYTVPEGYYIGSSRDAHRLMVRRGLRQLQPRMPQNEESNGGRGRTCCIGFQPEEQKWYGWSHRAIYGFGIGSKVDSADHLCATSGWTEKWLAEHPEDDVRLPVGFVAKTLEDAKMMATVFASAVN